MKANLRIILAVLLIELSSGCAYISEIGLLHEANMADVELVPRLKMDLNPNVNSGRMIVKRDGSLWSLNDGYDKHNKLSKSIFLGRDTNDFFGRVEFIDNVKEVVSASEAVIVLKNDGTVWSWGMSEFGRPNRKTIGWLGYHDERMFTPKQVQGLPFMASLVATGGGIAGVDSKGFVWRWGEVKLQSHNDKEKEQVISGNAAVYDLSVAEYKNLDIYKPYKIKSLNSIKKISRLKSVYLTESGDVYQSIPPEYVERMKPFLGKKIGLNLFKIKLPYKAVDIKVNTVLLENGHVYELEGYQNILEGGSYGNEVLPARHLKGLSQVIKIGHRVAVTQGGHIYKWGRIYYFGSPSERITRFTATNPVYVGLISEKVSFLTKDLLFTENGSIYLYRNQNTYFDFNQNYLPEESKPYYEKNYWISPLARRKSIRNLTTYYKLKEITR